jgi:hypothetical protein
MLPPTPCRYCPQPVQPYYNNSREKMNTLKRGYDNMLYKVDQNNDFQAEDRNECFKVELGLNLRLKHLLWILEAPDIPSEL